jgi:hypothetical protein
VAPRGGTGKDGGGRGSPESQVDGEGGVKAVARQRSEAAAESDGRRDWRRCPAAGQGKREDVVKWRRSGAPRWQSPEAGGIMSRWRLRGQIRRAQGSSGELEWVGG